MGTVKIKDKELTVSTDYEALVLVIQEFIEELKRGNNQ